MGLLSTPRLDPDDPRCQTDAYISLQKHLYEVLGIVSQAAGSGMLHVRNCRTEYPAKLTARDVAESLLVKAAPDRLTLPEGWGTNIGRPLPPRIESD